MTDCSVVVGFEGNVPQDVPLSWGRAITTRMLSGKSRVHDKPVFPGYIAPKDD